MEQDVRLMTNFEWLNDGDEVRLKRLLAYGLAVCKDTGKIETCTGLRCNECLFTSSKNGHRPCQDVRRDWLEEKHWPLYKRGDVILLGSGDLAFVISEKKLSNTIIVSNNIADLNNGIGVAMNIDNVKQKYCNILDDCNMEEV